MLVMQKPTRRSNESIFAFHNVFNLWAYYVFLIVGWRSANEQLGTDSLPSSFSTFRLCVNFISSISRCVKYYSVSRGAVDFTPHSPNFRKASHSDYSVLRTIVRTLSVHVRIPP